MSYRDSEAGCEIIQDIQSNIDDVPEILNHLDAYIDKYVADLQNPDLPTVHHVRGTTAFYEIAQRFHTYSEKGEEISSSELVETLFASKDRGEGTRQAL